MAACAQFRLRGHVEFRGVVGVVCSLHSALQVRVCMSVRAGSSVSLDVISLQALSLKGEKRCWRAVRGV